MSQGCYCCKNRTGLKCPHWTNMEHMVNEEQLRTFSFLECCIGSSCSDFARIPIPIIVAFNGRTVFDGEIT